MLEEIDESVEPVNIFNLDEPIKKTKFTKSLKMSKSEVKAVKDAADLMIQQEKALLQEFSKAFSIRSQMRLDKARWTFPSALCMNEFSHFNDAEKARIFSEFKCFVHFKQEFKTRFLAKEFEEFN